MSPRTGRGARLLALALATSTAVVAAGAPAASATSATSAAAPAATQTTTSSRGTAQSSVVRLVLTLPSQLADPLVAALPKPIELGLVGATGQLLSTGSDRTSIATSDLAFGTLVNASALSPVLQPLLSRNLTATLANPNPTSTVPPLTLPPNQLGLTATLGGQTAKVAPASLANGSSTQLAAVGLGNLTSLGLPPQLVASIDQIKTAVAQLKMITDNADQLAQVTGPLQTAVDKVQGPLQGVTCTTLQLAQACSQLGVSPTAPILPTVDATTLPATLKSIPDQVNAILTKLQTGALISVDGVSAGQSIDPAGAGLVAKGNSTLADVSLLGGLVTVTGSKATATASTSGKAGGAAADATATLLDAKVDTGLTTLLQVLLNGNGLTGTVVQGGVADGPVKTLIANVNGALAVITKQLGDMVGLKVQQGTTSKSAAPDGSKAEAHAAPATLALSVPGLDNLVALSVGAVDVTAARTTTVTALPVVAPAKAPAKPVIAVAPTKRLAFTGAELPVTGGIALALVLAAAAAARRRRDTLADDA